MQQRVNFRRNLWGKCFEIMLQRIHDTVISKRLTERLSEPVLSNRVNFPSRNIRPKLLIRGGGGYGPMKGGGLMKSNINSRNNP